MIVVSVMYPAGAEGSFDQAYYLEKHIPLVKERWNSLGLENVQVLRGAGTPDGSAAPFQMMALLTFRSLEAFQGAGKAHGREIFADIPKFTSVQPVVQVNEALG